MRIWHGIVCVALLLAGCTNESTLAVRLRTEMRPGIEFDRVETVIYAGTGIAALDLPQSVAPAIPVTESRDTFNGERVAEFRAVTPGSYLVRVQLLDGRRVVGTGLTAAVVEDASQLVDVFINRQCRGVECPGESGRLNEIACLGGRCVDPSCPADPAACPPPDCSRDEECPGGEFDCVTGRCLAGFCVTFTEDARCGAGTCLLGAGCIDDTDAGPPDGGPPDAGEMDAGTDGGVDGGPSDAGPFDAGPPDAGPPDAGPPDTGPPDAGPPPCSDVPRSTLNISFLTLSPASSIPPAQWNAPTLTCPATSSGQMPYFRESVYCNRETAPYDFSFTIQQNPFMMDLIANPTVWGYRGSEVPADNTDCTFVTTGLDSETPQILLAPGEYFTIRVGSTTTGTEGGFYLRANP